MGNIYFNSTDLSALGLSIGSLDRSAPGKEQFTADAYLREHIDRWDKRYENADISISGTLSHHDRDGFLGALDLLSAAVSPDLGWCALQVEDVADRYIVAKGNGVRVAEEWPMFQRPFLPVELSFLRLNPFWYSTVESTGSIPGVIENEGTLVTYPVWTAVAGTGGVPAAPAPAGSFSFTVGVQTFTYLAALAEDDVVSVYTDPAILSVSVNGAEAAPASVYQFTAYPYLSVGNTLCTVSGNVSASYSYYERYVVGA